LIVVTRSLLPCFVIEVPSEVIVAASASTAQLLASAGSGLVGRRLEDFLADDPTGALELLLSGRLQGYEATRHSKKGHEEIPVHFWVQALRNVAPPRYALVVAWEGDVTGYPPAPPIADGGLPPVVGTVDRDLVIDRLSFEAQTVLGYPPETLIGQSLLRVVTEPDVANLLLALAQAATSGRGATQRARVHTAAGSAVLCWVLLLPLAPLPSMAFALLPGEEPIDEAAGSARAMKQIIQRLSRTIDAATLSRALSEMSWGTSSLLSRLSSRELDIVRRLAAGDRVPTIAASLYISQSTVRNHLSTVFRKLGVHSQQELIVLLREMNDPSPDV
jgi:DNA-binding CsgD family transcriptional regulator/PAS domain-containing protein